MSVGAIVVAAGTGARFGAAKQFAALGATTVLDRALETVRQTCDTVVVVVGDPGGPWQPPPGVTVAAGGPTRADSVRSGLAALPSECDVVVVHDAARPLAPASLFSAVVAAVRGGADGAVPALAVHDTLKRVAGDRVVETIDRTGVHTVQTPQAFRADSLRRAHAGGGDATDDAALVEADGGRVVVVPGDARNVKITTPEDLAVAASHLEGR